MHVKSHWVQQWIAIISVLLLGLLSMAVSFGQRSSSFGESALSHNHPRYRRATIQPSLVHVDPGAEQHFKIVLVATRLMGASLPKNVKWAVNDIPGGNGAVGTIDASGTYRAPRVVPSPREIHIGATVPEAANAYLFGTVIVGDGPVRYHSIHTWTEKTNEDDEASHLVTPHGIGLDKDGNILIADVGASQVYRYTVEGRYLGKIGDGPGSSPGQVTRPREVRSDIAGRIFVTDNKGDRPRVQVFSEEGNFQQIFAEKGRLPGMLFRAHGMDFDTKRRLFVVDVDNMRVNVYDKEGNSLYDWGTEGFLPGEFNAPHGLYVDRSGDIFVTGYYGPTQKFNAEGEFVLAFGHGDPPDGPVHFHSVSGDKWGDAYLSVRDRGDYRGDAQSSGETRANIVKYNNNGDFIASWAFSERHRKPAEVVVNDEGLVYTLFTSEGEAGVETFKQK